MNISPCNTRTISHQIIIIIIIIIIITIIIRKLCTKSVQYLPKLLINGVLIPCVEMGTLHAESPSIFLDKSTYLGRSKETLRAG